LLIKYTEKFDAQHGQRKKHEQTEQKLSKQKMSAGNIKNR
jgi:hypothetical protein